MSIDMRPMLLYSGLIFAVLLLWQLFKGKYNLFGTVLYIFTFATFVALLYVSVMPFRVIGFEPNEYSLILIPFVSRSRYISDNFMSMSPMIRDLALIFAGSIAFATGAATLIRGEKIGLKPYFFSLALFKLAILRGLFDVRYILDTGLLVVMLFGNFLGILLAKWGKRLPLLHVFRDRQG